MATFLWLGEDTQTWSFRGSKSRNKVSVGEPAEGSLLVQLNFKSNQGVSYFYNKYYFKSNCVLYSMNIYLNN